MKTRDPLDAEQLKLDHESLQERHDALVLAIVEEAAAEEEVKRLRAELHRAETKFKAAVERRRMLAARERRLKREQQS